MHHLYFGKKVTKIMDYFYKCLETAQSKQPTRLGENSPNLVTLDLALHKLVRQIREEMGIVKRAINFKFH
jgi:hypothetical protein